MSGAAYQGMRVGALSLLLLPGIVSTAMADNAIPSADTTYEITTSGSYVVSQGIDAGKSTANSGVRNRAIGSTLINNGTISASGDGLYLMSGSMSSVTNSSTGTISGSYDGIDIAHASQSITTLINQGTIASTSQSGANYGIYNPGTIGTLLNTGTISGSGTRGWGIKNDGTIANLTNGQTNLTYKGVPPGRYNTLFTASGSYGKTYFSLTGTTLTYGLTKASGVSYATGTYYNVVSSTQSLTITDTSVSGVTYALVQHRGSIGYTCAVAVCYDLVIRAVGSSDT